MSDLFHIGDSPAFSGLFAVMDNPYLVLAIVIISALSSWFQSRNKKKDQAEPWGGEDDENYQPHRSSGSSTPAPAPNQALNWEEELKRLLEGKPPLDSTAGAPPPMPPPIVRRVPPPPPVPQRVSRESQGVDEESIASRESSSPWKDTSYDSLPEPTKPLANLEHHTQAYQRATQLHESVAARMHHVSEQTEKHGKPLAAPRMIRRDAGSADARAVVALLRRPSTARQALLASFVLAPPKALEN
ncbi:MAG: hypothetical protein ABMA26_18085 [Limisphaerales bacterium]